MRRSILVTVAIVFCGVVSACERRSVPAASDAATTGAPVLVAPVAIEEPLVGDASTTSALVPVERPVEASRDASVTPTVAPESEAALPRWVPRNAPLTIIQSSDLERNLGIVPPPPPAPNRVTVDAGGVAVEIEIRSRP